MELLNLNRLGWWPPPKIENWDHLSLWLLALPSMLAAARWYKHSFGFWEECIWFIETPKVVQKPSDFFFKQRLFSSLGRDDPVLWQRSPRPREGREKQGPRADVIASHGNAKLYAHPNKYKYKQQRYKQTKILTNKDTNRKVPSNTNKDLSEISHQQRCISPKIPNKLFSYSWCRICRPPFRKTEQSD